MIDYAELDRARADDRAFFDQNCDREYRLRRSWPCEIGPGEIPAGYTAFRIFHRYNLMMPEAEFGARITLETKRDDAAIRKILAALAANPHAMLTAE